MNKNLFLRHSTGLNQAKIPSKERKKTNRTTTNIPVRHRAMVESDYISPETRKELIPSAENKISQVETE